MEDHIGVEIGSLLSSSKCGELLMPAGAGRLGLSTHEHGCKTQPMIRHFLLARVDK